MTKDETIEPSLAESRRNQVTIFDKTMISAVMEAMKPARIDGADALIVTTPTYYWKIVNERIKEIPDDLVDRLLAAGKAEWAADEPMTDADHLKRFAEALEKTRERVDLPETTALHSVHLVSTGQILCFTGNSPNSGQHARALVGAWNHLVELASLQREALAEAPSSGDGVKKDHVMVPREPTDAMCDAGYDWHDHVSTRETMPMTRGVYRAMINAANDAAASLQRAALAEAPSSAEGVDNKDRAP